MHRRRVMSTMGSLGLLYGLLASNSACAADSAHRQNLNPDPWSNFKTNFVSEDGRVIDLGSERRQTYSEGQGYALFFALVANDRITFAKLLQWTEANLCKGDMTACLPAWLWGRKDDQTWGVLDDNSASDADLWIAYSLGEAGRLWSLQRYKLLSEFLIARILKEETARIPSLGLSLLPAPKGFVVEGKTWRLNPSYMPMHLMHWLSVYQADAQWREIEQSSLKIIVSASPMGYVPDWILYDEKNQFSIDKNGIEKGQGAYNAIRTYLWAGFLDRNYEHKSTLTKKLSAMAIFVKNHGYPPESIDVLSGKFSNPGSTGFSAALLPFLASLGDEKTLKAQQQRIEVYPPRQDEYYPQVLKMFGEGWLYGLYKFNKNGQLLTRWKN